MTLSPPRRFYRSASAGITPEGFAVLLDGRPVRTPAGHPLRVPGRDLAEALAAEWDAQGDTIRPSTMPLTQLVSTAIDRVGPERPTIHRFLLAYAGTDLLCYRNDHPADLRLRQERHWQPLLDWAAEALNAPLQVTAGLLAVSQPAEALAALSARLEAQDVWRLTAIQSVTAATGSLLVAFALAEGRIDATTAWAVSLLDETYQIERWGEDAEATARRTTLEADIAAAARLLALAAVP